MTGGVGVRDAWSIRIQDVGKWYVPGRPRLRRHRGARPPAAATVALEAVTLDVLPGRSLGVVGANGAGKTTLLRLLAGITAPSTGVVEVRGRLASLIELGVGFHPDLTGRENARYTAMLLGSTAAEADARWDEVAEVAGIGDAVDWPAKHCSSGMLARLGFAVATTVDADVVVVDEVLAVGDLDFQARSLARLRELTDAGRSTVLVSHDLAAVASLCDEVVLLDHGRVRARGAPDDVIGAYAGATRVAAGDGAVRVRDLSIVPASLRTGATATVRVTLDADRAVPGASVRLRLGFGSVGRAWLADLPASVLDTTRLSDDPIPLTLDGVGTWDLVGTVGPFTLPPGDYTVGVHVHDAHGDELARAQVGLDLVGDPGLGGHLELPAAWQVGARRR